MKTTHQTKDGTVMLITEMTDAHLQNTIAAKERWWSTQMQPYLEELERRGLKRRPWWKSVWIAVRKKFEPHGAPSPKPLNQRSVWAEYPFEYEFEQINDGQDFFP